MKDNASAPKASPSRTPGSDKFSGAVKTVSSRVSDAGKEPHQLRCETCTFRKDYGFPFGRPCPLSDYDRLNPHDIVFITEKIGCMSHSAASPQSDAGKVLEELKRWAFNRRHGVAEWNDGLPFIWLYELRDEIDRRTIKLRQRTPAPESAEQRIQKVIEELERRKTLYMVPGTDFTVGKVEGIQEAIALLKGDGK